MYVCMYVYCKELYSLQYVFITIQLSLRSWCWSWVWSWVWSEICSVWPQIWCSLTAHWVLIELRFELKSLTFCKFWRSFDWNLEKSRKFPRESLKLGFLALPSVKHFKKYEKGGFLELCLDLWSECFVDLVTSEIVSSYL